MKRLHKRFLLATFCTLFTATLQAADVTITVNGRVVAKPCTIQTKEANVNLGDLYTRNLQQPGSASGWHNITLSLTDCPIETSAVTAIVTGSTDNTGYYKNEGTAENIQIELRDDQDATLKNGDSKTVIVDEITRNAQFPLKARAITVIISNNSVVMPTGGCTVDSRNVTVNLPDFPGSAEIPLGVYCSSEQKLSFYLSGATTDSARQVFANTAPDATKASGVGVSLMRNGKILATGENVSLGTVNKSKVPLGLSATYGQTGNKVAAGTVQSVIGVTFIYE